MAEAMEVLEDANREPHLTAEITKDVRGKTLAVELLERQRNGRFTAGDGAIIQLKDPRSASLGDIQQWCGDRWWRVRRADSSANPRQAATASTDRADRAS